MLDKNNDGVPDLEISIDGTKVKTKDLFPDAASRLDFHTKLKLLKSPSSGEADGMQGLEDKPSLEDALFKGTGKKVKLIGKDGKER